MLSLRYLLPAVATARLAYAASCSGPMTIQNSGDASAIAGCPTYSGSITVATQAADEVRIDTLQHIDGDLNVVSADDLTSLAADSLTSISGTFKLQGVRQLTTLDFPELTEVGDIDWQTLPGLAGLSFDAGITKAKSITILDTQLQDLSGITLQEIDKLVVQSNTFLTNVSFDLETINDEFTLSANGPDCALSLGSLTEAKNLVLQNLGSIDLPELKKVDGVLDVEDGSYESFEAPKLTEVGSTLTVQKNAQLSKISMEALETCGGGFVIAANPMLKTIDGLDKLTSISGNLDFTGEFDDVKLPKLASVKGAFNMQSKGDITDVCSDFKGDAGRNLPIRGKFTCIPNKDNPTSIGGGNGGNGGGDDGDSLASLTGVPTGLVMGLAGVSAAVFGLF